MFKKRKMKQIAAVFDGEVLHGGAPAPEPFDRETEQYRDALATLRQGAAQAARTPEISDAQFGAFMQGIREGIERPAPRLYGLWTMASFAAAMLIVLLSVLAFLTAGPDPVRATEVESYSTELEGVTIQSYENQKGVSTVWVTMPESDLW